MPRITEMYAFVYEEKPEDEGIMAMMTAAGWMPLVGADMARVESLRPVAISIARKLGRSIKLVHFTNREEVETI